MIRRLLADADLNTAIISGISRRNALLDFKRAEQVPLEGLTDLAVLSVAAEERRVLVSHDVSTLPSHLRQFAAEHSSPGVILIPQDMGIGPAIENLLLICEACDPPDLENRICLLRSLLIYGF